MVHVYKYTDYRTPSVRCGYFFARQSEPLARPQFKIRTSTRSALVGFGDFCSGTQIPLREPDRRLPMRSNFDTPSIKRP
ncbi:hypothetical protein Taro_046075 [Colocasia esculenta]|uniref:Uncharacterized protein n=1 Tax=Colocasia esculenta TaxID=4460 RepID=A0A843WYH1_COLES|nr:hypothetical protein [Colocasia esculenta]